MQWRHPTYPPPLQGLHVGDTIVEFGSVTSPNFTSLQEIATVVQHSNEVGMADYHAMDTLVMVSFVL